MNNLKRVLGLGLVGTMLAGMLTMGASAADFTDADKIQHDEAVNVLVALNVIDGKPDGSFDPEGNVTRAEMAKMIAVAMNGGSDANTGTKTTPTYTDIKGHWAESYIEYCADLGIISGRGDGTFDPGANVKGLEATKMVLTALGYDATAYKLTGNSWAVRTDELARTADPKLYEDLETVMMAENATRDTAAQLIWNGLQNKTRKVTPSTNTSTGEVTWQYNSGDEMLTERYGAKIFKGTFVGNYYTGDTTVKGEIKVGNVSIPSDFDISNIGEEVKVIWKDGKDGTKGQLDAKDVIYGVFNTGASKVVTGKLSDVKDQKSSKTQINIGGTKYELTGMTGANNNVDTGVDVVVNYATQVSRTGDVLTANGVKHYNTAAITGVDDVASTTADESANSQLTTDLKKATGDTIKAVMDPDTDKITTIYVTTTKLAAVTAINSTKITLNNNVGSITIADNDVAEDLKKGDVVTVSTLYKSKATDDDAFTIVKKAETVEGEVDGWKESETVTLDGTKYSIYNKAAFGLTSIPDEDNVIKTFKDTGNDYIGEDVKLYMVNGYVGAAVQTSEAANNYSLITEVKSNATAGSAFSGLQLQVMDAEGNKTIVNVSDDSKDMNGDGDIDEDDYNVGDIVTYTINKDKEAEVTVEGQIAYNGVGAYDDSVKTFDGTVTTSDCVLFVQTETGKTFTSSGDKLIAGAKWKAYQIRDLKTLTSAGSNSGATVAYDKDGKVVAAFVNYAQGKNPAGATDNTIYGIISAANGRVKDYYSYTVKSNGEEYVVNSKDGSNVLKKGMLVSFEEARDNNYAAGEVKPVVAGTGVAAIWVKEADKKDALTYYTGVNNTSNGYVGYGMKTLAMDDDVVIIGVDVDADDSTAEADIMEFDSVTGYANAVIVTEKQGNPQKDVIVAVFVETSNEENILANPTQAALTAADIKNMADGTFVPSAASSDLASSAAASDLRVFKFTADTTNNEVKLEIKDSAGAVVYTEAGPLTSADGEGHYFWVAVGDLAKATGGTLSGAWSGQAAAPAGNYTYAITAGTDGSTYGATLSTGSFSF